MADGSNREDELEEQIRRLQREKIDLERKKEQDKERDRSRDTGGSLRRGNDDDNTDRNRRTTDPMPSTISSLEDSQSRLKGLLQSTIGGKLSHDRSGGSNHDQDDNYCSSDDGQDDDVMSQRHKQILRSNRDVLVDNMTPDDIFNDLISKHVFSNADVSRIKEKNTLEAQNEELLNMLCRRSDRAFYVFTSSLRRTLQAWLANRLDPQASSKHKRKRRTGEMNVNVDCQEVIPSGKKRYVCSCEEVEEQILQMAKGAFSNIRRRDTSASAHEQFRKELQQTNEIVKDSLEIVNSLKLLCRHGDVTNLSSGSICFTICCRSVSACHQLWSDYTSGVLLEVCQQGLVTPSLLRACGAQAITLRVRMNEGEYLTCLGELGSSDHKPNGTPIKRRLRRHSRVVGTSDFQDENRDIQTFSHDRCGDYLGPPSVCASKRQALHEIPSKTNISFKEGPERTTPFQPFDKKDKYSPSLPKTSRQLQRMSLAKNRGFTVTVSKTIKKHVSHSESHLLNNVKSIKSFIHTRTHLSEVEISKIKHHSKRVEPCRYNLRLKLNRIVYQV